MSLRNELAALDPEMVTRFVTIYDEKASGLAARPDDELEQGILSVQDRYPGLTNIVRALADVMEDRRSPESLHDISFGAAFAVAVLIEIAEVQDMPGAD